MEWGHVSFQMLLSYPASFLPGISCELLWLLQRDNAVIQLPYKTGQKVLKDLCAMDFKQR